MLGSILAVSAVGLTLTFRILNFANFAHGDVMTFGAYLVLLFKVSLGWPLWLAVVTAMAGTALLSLVVDRTVYRRLRSQGPIALLIGSVGVALIVRNFISVAWGPDNQFFTQGIIFPWRVWGILIKPNHALIVCLAVVLALVVHVFLRYTKLGKAMRAVSDNPTLAEVSGIDTERIVLWTWIIASALACAAGVMIGIDTELLPQTGWNLLLPIFAAVILGGVGSPYGAMAGGMIIGITQEMSTAFISTSYKPVVAFVIMIVILLLRPSGIFDTKGAVKL